MGAPERLGNVSLILRNVVHISTTRTWLAETRLAGTRTYESVRRAMYLRCRDNSRRFGQNAPPHRVLILAESRSPVAQGGGIIVRLIRSWMHPGSSGGVKVGNRSAARDGGPSGSPSSKTRSNSINKSST